MKEATLWSLTWVAVSFAFVGWLWWYLGGPDGNETADAKALEFVTGYLVEKALAVDNIFVFLLVFTYFAVPAEYQKRVLMFGILGALVLRAIMILVGAWLIASRCGWPPGRNPTSKRIRRSSGSAGTCRSHRPTTARSSSPYRTA